jgi:hypothetical protein
MRDALVEHKPYISTLARMCQKFATGDGVARDASRLSVNGGTSRP